ncbi:MAG: hypothetical protein HFI91_11270 [Lachnospiraceae bacterium]|nr:hypothetical protein [Lachnospiraceae bacterium]
MRKFSEQGSRCLTDVICNCCGRKITTENGIVKEGCVSLEIPFGFFSEKDGEIHCFDLCEFCYDRMIADFQIPVEIQEATELI